MKSDDEFIAGIYKKAEKQKIEEEKTAQALQNAGRRKHFMARCALASVACLCLIVLGAVYAGKWHKQPGEASPAQGGLAGDGAVMTLMLDEPGMPVDDSGAGQGDHINPRGRMAPYDDVLIGENAVMGGLFAGFSIAYPAGDQNPAGEDETNMP